MATWEAIAEANLAAAKLLLNAGQDRSATSRAYYAAFASATGFLAAHGIAFPIGREGPAHARLPELLGRALPLSPGRKLAVQNIRALYELRLLADYRTRTLRREEAVDAVRRSDVFLREIGRR